MIQVLTQDRIMYKIWSDGTNERPKPGTHFKYKKSWWERTFGIRGEVYFKFALVENHHFNLDLLKVKIPAGAYFENTTWGALVSEYIVIN